MTVVEGQLVAGKFRVQRVLGQGGMGVVVAAHHVALDQVVAIKLLLPEALGDAQAVARFEREARAAVKIQSEHVARVTDVGRIENGAPYMVMELLRGRDLEQLQREQGPLPLPVVADYLLQAGEAIAEAHGLGIVHRDLKPANLFLTHRADGSTCIKVLDFGISKLTESGRDQGITNSSTIMGSPLYMSPEQLMSARDVDMRTDIWSLGVICFQLLTGKPPFLADTLPQLCMAIRFNPPTPMRDYRPDLPLEVEEILFRCLEKDPGKRYATVAELAGELVKFAPRSSRVSAERIERLARAAGFSASALALPPSSNTGAEPSAGGQTLTEFGRTRAGSPSNKFRMGLGLLGLLGLASAGTFALSHQPSSKAGTVLASALSPSLVEPPLPMAPASSATPEPPLAAPVSSTSAEPSARPAPLVVPLPSSQGLSKAKPSPSTASTVPAKAVTKLAPSIPKKPSLGGRL